MIWTWSCQPATIINSCLPFPQCKESSIWFNVRFLQHSELTVLFPFLKPPFSSGSALLPFPCPDLLKNLFVSFGSWQLCIILTVLYKLGIVFLWSDGLERSWVPLPSASGILQEPVVSWESGYTHFASIYQPLSFVQQEYLWTWKQRIQFSDWGLITGRVNELFIMCHTLSYFILMI